MNERESVLNRRIKRGSIFALFVLTCLFASHAFAEEPLGQSGQTGSGNTSLVLHLQHTGEYGGTKATGTEANPDLDGDGLGDNLAFTVPTRIDFIATSDGTLTGPNADVVYIENESTYSVHVSSLKVSALNRWNIVEDVRESSLENSVDFLVGPSEDKLNGAVYLQKTDVAHPQQWNMGPRKNDETSDRVQLEFTGHINNVTFDLSQEVAFGQIEWYVTPGVSGRA